MTISFLSLNKNEANLLKFLTLTYLSISSIMLFSSQPPKTLNLFKLQTCAFSYFPKVIDVTIAGRGSNFKIRYWGGVLVSEDQRDDWSFGLSSRMLLNKKKTHLISSLTFFQNQINVKETICKSMNRSSYSAA